MLLPLLLALRHHPKLDKVCDKNVMEGFWDKLWLIAFWPKIVHLFWYAIRPIPVWIPLVGLVSAPSERRDKNPGAFDFVGGSGASGRDHYRRRAAQNAGGLAHVLEKFRRFGRAHQDRLATARRNQSGRNPLACSRKTHRR